MASLVCGMLLGFFRYLFMTSVSFQQMMASMLPNNAPSMLPAVAVAKHRLTGSKGVSPGSKTSKQSFRQMMASILPNNALYMLPVVVVAKQRL